MPSALPLPVCPQVKFTFRYIDKVVRICYSVITKLTYKFVSAKNMYEGSMDMGKYESDARKLLEYVGERKI